MRKTESLPADTYLDTAPPRELQELNAALGARVVGQDEAITEIVRALVRYRAGLAGQECPIGAFLLLGPSGVGKTLTVEALAELLHGSPRAVLKIHCAELRSDHELARMKGSPPGYVGWKECVPLFHEVKLKEVRLREAPALVLFDEIEKAHPALWDLLLGLLDKGEVVLNDNTRTDFRKTMVFLTGNLGAREMTDALSGSMGFQPHTRGDVAGIATRAADRLFSPEFRNRLTATLTYRALGWEAILRICRLELGRLSALLRGGPAGIVLQFEGAAVEQIARQGSGPEPGAFRSGVAGETSAAHRRSGAQVQPGASVFGARHLRRVIERMLKDPLAYLLASGGIQPGDCVVVCAGAGDGQPLRFRRRQ